MSDDKRAKLKYLQDIFKGQVEPDVVDLVLVESQYNEEKALEQLFSLTGNSKKVNGGLPSSGSKLDDLDPIDESFSIVNIQQLSGQVDKYSTNHQSGKSRKEHKRNNNDTCLVPNSTNVLTETLNFETAPSKPLAPYDSLPLGSTEPQYTNEHSSQEKSSISKAAGVEDAKTKVESELVGNADADNIRNAFNNTFSNWARSQANGFSTNYEQSKDSGIKQNQSSNFNSNKKLLHQDLEGLPVNRVPKSALGYSALNPSLPAGYPYMFPQTTQAYYGGQHQYFPSSSNPYSPPAFVRPEGRSLATGHQGQAIAPQFTKPSHKQHPSFKKQSDIDKRPSYLCQTNAYPKALKAENLSPHCEKLLIILRGLPGSGKTTLARAFKTKNGLTLSTDDYFMKGGRYTFNPYELTAAHEWNQNRAKRFMEGGLTPVIIDNTNTEAWEMKPYVLIGLQCGYRVAIKEPETRWKWDIKELERRNSHGVTAKSLEKMLERYEKNITVETIKKSFCPVKLNDSERGTKEQVSKSKPNDKNTSTGSNSENLVHFVSNVDSEVRKPIATKGFLSSQPPQRSHLLGSSDPTKCCVNGDTPGTVNHSSAQLIPSTDEGMIAEKEEPSCNEEHGEKKGDSRSKVKGDIEHSSSTRNSSVVNTDKLLRVENTDEEEEEDASNEGSCSLNTNESLENKAKASGDFKSRNTASLSPDKSSRDHACTPHVSVKSKTENELPTLNIPPAVSQAHFSPEVKAGNIERAKIKHCTEIQNDKISPDRANEMVVSESFIPRKTRKGNSPQVTKGVGNDLLNEDTSIITAVPRIKGSKDATNADMASSTNTVSVENTKLEMSNKNGDSPDPMKFLEDCFPHIDNGVLRSSLNYCHGDLMKTVDYLLQHNENGNVEDFHNVPTSDVSTSELNSSLTSATSPSQHSLNHTAESYNEDIEGTELVTGKNTGGNSPVKPSATPVPSTPNSKNDLEDISCPSLHFTLEPALALQLLEMFGSFSGVSAKAALSESDRSIKIDEEFAKRLYNKWRRSVQKKMKSKASGEAKLKKNKDSSSPRVLPGSNSKQKFKPPPPEFYLPKEVPNRPRGITHVTLHEPVSLKEIMDEQFAVHVSQSSEDVDKRSKEESLDLSIKLKRSRLHGMFPGVNALSLNELFEANDYNFDNTVQQVQSSCGLPISGNPSILPERKPADVQPINKPEDEVTEYQSFDDPTYKDFRAEATTHFKLRDECIKKAALAYSKKQGELSQIYAQQARVHSTKIKEANQRAVDKIFEIRVNDLYNTNTLDLHDLHVNEAIEVLKSVLDERKEELFVSNKRSPSSLQVITGRGSHSRDGKPRIKPAVVEYLKRNEYRFEELNMGLYRVFLN